MPPSTGVPYELVLGLPLAGPLRTLSPRTNGYYEAGHRQMLWTFSFWQLINPSVPLPVAG